LLRNFGSLLAQIPLPWPKPLGYRDSSFDGPMAQRFGIHAIPSTFTIDA
jgi:hypothetical protein